MEGIRLDLRELTSLQRAARGLKTAARRRVRAVTAGQAKTVLRSRGMDYAESRAYQPGDDIRDIDWRVTARTGQTHTKLYEEEKHRPVFFVLDYSQRMQFGTKVAFKSVIAAKALTTLAWAAYGQRDNIGGMVFSENGHSEIRPMGGQRGVQQLLNRFVTDQPALSTSVNTDDDTTPLADALHRLALVARPGSLVIIASDFADLPHSDAALRSLRMLAQHCELIMLNIVDPLEQHLPKGAFAFSDMHGKQSRQYDLQSNRAQQRYHTQFQEQQQQLEQVALQHRAMLVTLHTDDDLALTLYQYFGK